MRPQKYILSTLITIIILSGIIYAISYPINLPAGQTSGGTFSLRLANIIGSCPANTFLKGFDLSFNRICVPSSGIYSGPAITSPAVPSGYPYTAPAGQYTNGKMGTYFNNLRGICPGNKIVKGFATDGFKYCVDPASSAIYTPHTSQISLGISWPTTPSGQINGGKFQTFFTNMFTTCAGDKIVQSINTDGTLVCVPPPGPFAALSGKVVSCVWSNAITLYGMIDSNGNPFVRVTFGINIGEGRPTDSWWVSGSSATMTLSSQEGWGGHSPTYTVTIDPDKGIINSLCGYGTIHNPCGNFGCINNNGNNW